MDSLFDTPYVPPETGGLPSKVGKLPIHLLHQLACKVCPLAQVEGNRHPDMPAYGSESPLVYILGEAPGRDEDEEGRQFVGKSGQLLHQYVPRHVRKSLRYNNVVRTRPYKNETPSDVAIECCRPSVVKDIERTKPRAIFGFGNVPLEWATGWTGTTIWRGRRTPVKIGEHSCWYYPMLHPAYLLRQGKGRADGEKAGGEEQQRAFKFDIKRAFAEVTHLPPARVHTPTEVFKNIELITEGIENVRRAIKWACAQPAVGFDWETNGLRPYATKARILTFAIATGKQGYAVAMDHPEATWTKVERAEITLLLKRFFKTQVHKYVHHLAFELEWIGVFFGRRYVRTPNWHDSAVQASILDDRHGKQKPGAYSLEFLVQQYFGFNLKKLSNVDRKRLIRERLHTVLMYNGGDARYHLLLGLAQKKLIERDELTFAYKLAVRRVPTLVLSQIKGVPVNQMVNEALRLKYEKRQRIAEKKLFALNVVQTFERRKKRKFNPFSNPDVLYVVKDIMKRPEVRIVDKYDESKIKFSAEEKILAKIKHPFSSRLIALRKPTKRLSTYIYPYSDWHKDSVVWDDGLLHPTFNSYWAGTGRLSAEDPNLQNVPKRDEEAKEVRRQIEALRNRFCVAADYGQIEARLIALASGDKHYIKSLWEDHDIHTDWAEELARAYPSRVGGRKNLSDKKVMSDFRADIKNQWTFPLFFGASLGKASTSVSIPESVLKPLYDKFWRIFTGVRDWQEDLIAFYNKNGYVETLNHRRRRAPLSRNQLINAPIQGTAAEIVMTSMCRLSETRDWDLQPEINIHDDLTWISMPEGRLDELCEKVIDIMLDIPFKWARAVPWSIEMSYGKNWLDQEKLGTFFSHHWFADEKRIAA